MHNTPKKTKIEKKYIYGFYTVFSKRHWRLSICPQSPSLNPPLNKESHFLQLLTPQISYP